MRFKNLLSLREAAKALIDLGQHRTINAHCHKKSDML